MLKTLNSLHGVSVLSKEAQKKVTGGGTCAYTNADGEVVYNVSMAEAKRGATETGMLMPGSGHWCCSSCSTAGWYKQY